MALSFHVMFCYHDALLFRVPPRGLVFLRSMPIAIQKFCRRADMLDWHQACQALTGYKFDSNDRKHELFG